MHECMSMCAMDVIVVTCLFLKVVIPVVSADHLDEYGLPRYDFNYGEMNCPEWKDLDLQFFFSSETVPMGAPLRAASTVPRGLRVGPSRVPGAGLGVYATTFLPRYMWLVKFQGDFVYHQDVEGFLHYAWELTAGGKGIFFLDAQDPRGSNWPRYVNGARHEREQNVLMQQCLEHLYYMTGRDIAPGDELLIDYGPSYAHLLGVNYDLYANYSVAVGDMSEPWYREGVRQR